MTAATAAIIRIVRSLQLQMGRLNDRRPLGFLVVDDGGLIRRRSRLRLSAFIDDALSRPPPPDISRP
ncbi:MAG: hypothetical protein WB772_02345 [Xanthobacteraceae bacterium]